MPILDVGLQQDIRTSLLRPRIFAFRGSTAANGDITLAAGSDYDGAFSAPSRNTNTYTITLGGFKSLLACNIRTGSAAVINSVTADGAAGTVTVVFNATLASTTLDAILVLDRGV